MAASTKLANVVTPESKTIDARDILTPAELAERLKVPLSWVYKQTAKSERANAIPVLRAGNYLRFDWQSVSDWLRTGTVKESL
jgi:hypothetical protein